MQEHCRLDKVNLFGVRHLSPSSADNLVKLLNQKKPKAILIECPRDATDWIDALVSNDVTLPAAILAYTTTFPINSIIIPFAEYSPEYQALKWSKDHKCTVDFIDLPSSTNLSFNSKDVIFDNNETEAKKEYIAYVKDTYRKVIELYDEPDYEAYWENHFEYINDISSYTQLLNQTTSLFRDRLESQESEKDERAFYYNLLRERYMLTQIIAYLNNGYAPEDIVVVVGAYHLSGLMKAEPLTTKEQKMLPSVATNVTLMPYSYFRLSSLSGYGAGTHAPNYFERLWTSRQKSDFDAVAIGYTTELAHQMRNDGFYVSTAAVIESVRLARGIAQLKGRNYPILCDIKDGITATIGEGSAVHLEKTMAMLDVGTKIGALKQGVSQTSIQNDFNHQLKRLKLEKYKSVVANDIKLDLRENIKVQSTESAFRDLNRSIFFNKLELLGVDFATRLHLSQDSGTWAEGWTLRWTPEVEIQVIESIFKGENIDVAVSFTIDEMLKASNNMEEIAEVVNQSFLCNLTKVVARALNSLEVLFVHNHNFLDAGNTCIKLSNVIKYKNLRRIDPTSCEDIFIKLFNRSLHLLISQSVVSDEVATAMVSVINRLYNISHEFSTLIDYPSFVKSLRTVTLDDRNHPLICGTVFSILMEKQEITTKEIDLEISRRFSVGNPPDLAGDWFYGLCMRNRYALLSRQELWEGLDNYLDTLNDEDFLHAMVYLRRALGTFDVREKTAVVELLSDLWGLNSIELEQILEKELSNEEQDMLNELDEFDFEDL